MLPLYGQNTAAVYENHTGQKTLFIIKIKQKAMFLVNSLDKNLPSSSSKTTF